MGLFGPTKDDAKSIVVLNVIAGKQNFNGAIGLSGTLTLKQYESGAVYVSGKNELMGFIIKGYQWDGPEYKSVTTTKETTNTTGGGWNKGHTKEKVKRTGRVTGAVVGTLIAPGIGTAIGAMVGTGNKKVKGTSTGVDQHREKATRTGTTSTMDVEIPGTAYMTLQNIRTQEAFTFSFKCDSKINVDIQNMLIRAKLI